ncbi:MAG: tyrosine-type recombinase/integrase [Gemmatimonadetes bacterium]|nr:tyrosine-type recombinase/integrase [Gemmatimonadota bacterium]
MPGDYYTRDSYRRAIARACKLAGIKKWSPNQLRHSAATRIRKAYDLDSARVLLGQRSPRITEIYAENDGGKAMRLMAEVG